MTRIDIAVLTFVAVFIGVCIGRVVRWALQRSCRCPVCRPPADPGLELDGPRRLSR